MRLTPMEIDILRATIGKRAARLFCPYPSIFRSYIEASSYTIWLDSKPYFVNIFSVGEEQTSLRIAVERSETPRDFQHDHDPLSRQGIVSNCADIHLETKDPSTIRQIGIYEWQGMDTALLFGFDDGDKFALRSGDVFDEVSYYWPSEFGWIKENCTLRSVIDSSD